MNDHFSSVASSYRLYRPAYPSSLIEFLVDQTHPESVVWEAGCGSGQLSVLLSGAFKRVFAGDISIDQLSRAPVLPNVHYITEQAERSCLASSVADLCIAAQAAHWFNLPAYYDEVRRVARKGTILALVTYGPVMGPQGIDELIQDFAGRALAAYWPIERMHVNDGYSQLFFPFEETSSATLTMRESWTLANFLGYVKTWSAVVAARRVTGFDMLQLFNAPLGEAWGDERMAREFRWPLRVRLGAIATA